tara:strand:- start:4738 stop:5436 length:699 start_codon:yes stop_codon:yes gene_type:complete
MKNRSKRFKELEKITKLNKNNKLDSIITEIKKVSNAKFIESIDISFKYNLKKIKGSDTNLRTVVDLPNGNGRKIKVAVICDEGKLSDAKKSGAEMYGSEDLIKKISSGSINFDKLICTPGMMSKLGKLGKILGPKGLMPNPKLGTVSDDIIKAVDKIKNSLSEVKSDKDGNVALSFGRKSFTEKKLMENLSSIFQNLKKDKPNIFNSENIKSVYISSTMSPSYKINFKDVQV